MNKTSARTLARVAERAYTAPQPTRPAPVPQPPLRMVRPPVDLAKQPQPAAEPVTAPDPLPVREFMTEAAIRAHYAALLAGLPVTQIRDWVAQPNGTAQTDRGPRGTLTHTPRGTTPFSATIPCPRANAHTYPIATGSDLNAAEHHAQACRSTHGAHNGPLPAAERARRLGDDLHRAHAATADTHLTDVRTLRDAYDQPKEHPTHTEEATS